MEEQNLRLQEEAKQYVRSMGRWYKFFGILSIVGCVFMVLSAIMMLAVGGMMDEGMKNYEMYNSEGMGSMPTWLIGILYLVCAGLMVPVIVYMLRGAKAAETAVALNSNEAAVSFLSNSKSYWKFYGILTIVMLALCIIAIPIAIIAAFAVAL
jgi:membrane protein YqaA with SNARE-associated domain